MYDGSWLILYDPPEIVEISDGSDRPSVDRSDRSSTADPILPLRHAVHDLCRTDPTRGKPVLCRKCKSIPSSRAAAWATECGGSYRPGGKKCARGASQAVTTPPTIAEKTKNLKTFKAWKSYTAVYRKCNNTQKTRETLSKIQSITQQIQATSNKDSKLQIIKDSPFGRISISAVCGVS